jgi:hypothetical protein
MSLLREWLKEQGMSSLTEQESSRIKKVKIRKKLKTLTRAGGMAQKSRSSVTAQKSRIVPQTALSSVPTRTHAQEKYNRYPGRQPNTIKQ